MTIFFLAEAEQNEDIPSTSGESNIQRTQQYNLRRRPGDSSNVAVPAKRKKKTKTSTPVIKGITCFMNFIFMRPYLISVLDIDDTTTYQVCKAKQSDRVRTL